MPSITISRDRNTVGEQMGTITINPSGFSLPGGPNDRPIAYSNMQYQYRIDNGNWSNNKSFSIIKDNNSYVKTITASCRIKYTVSNYTWIPPVKDPETGITITSGYWQLQSTSTGYSNTIDETISIYFHPGSFPMGANSGDTIANILNEDKINNYWIPHFQAAYRWHNQKDISYSPANITYDYFSNNNNGGMKVKQNDPISAEWFNNCMEGMRQFGKEVDDVEKDELITASLINQMNFSGIN